MLVLLACYEQSLGELEGETLPPTPYESPERETPPPPLSLEEIEAAVPALISEVFELDPKPIFDAHSQMMSYQDSACPAYNAYYQELYGTYFWDQSCTSESGVYYNGWSEFLRLQDYDYGGTWINDYGYFKGDAELTDTEGQVFLMSGETLYNDLRYTDYNYWLAELAGAYRWEGTDFGDTWLGNSRNAFVSIEAYYHDFGARRVWLNGGVTGLEGGNSLVQTVSFDSLLWLSGEYGSGCPIEPGGTIRLRDEAGRWYEVFFHGPAEEGEPVFPPLCDGCGEVFENSVYVGNVCPDLSPLMYWGEEGPWR
jgi:hypothetical protein